MKATSDTRRPYSGPTRSIVCAIDVGTTFSGVSYSILEPGEVPKIFGVTRFPGQEHVAGNCKIPSILWYDTHGKMMAAGAEAESLAAQAEDEGWIKVDLFKLRLRPRSMHLNMNGMRLGRLPLGKTPIHVLGDFLSYLFACTRNFITDTHANGSALWASVEQDIKFVLSHPNGWEGAQQSKFRRAAIHGGLVPNTNEGKARVFFVTEGEASLHSCILNGLAADVLSDPSKPGFLIADAGGGTWDISAYSITAQNPLQIEEIAPSDCIFAGSVFVSRRAKRFLEAKLSHSKYGSPESIDHITKRFDETTKRLFRDDHSLQFVSFGSPLDKDTSVGIRGGKLKLTGEEVRDLFEPSIEAAFEAIKAQVDASSHIKSVWLVGGFAANHWLFSQLQERLAPYGVTVNRPDSQTSKAVCDGAVGFYVDHHVSVRMSKAFYGVEYLRTFDAEDPEHVSRESTLVALPSGPRLLPDAFDCILKAGIKVKESTVFSRKYSTELTSLNVLSVFEVLVWCYRGKSSEVPMWIYRHADEFSTLCVVRADLSPLKSTAIAQEGQNGTFWKIVFSIEIHFGLTEFRARIKWLDNGEVKYGPASIIYNERGRRVEEDEPDMFSEDDMTVASARSERVRSPPPLSRPPSSAAIRAPVPPTPRADTPAPPATERDSIPEVARLPDEEQPSRGGSGSGSERGSTEREPSRGRKSEKGKGKDKDKKDKQQTPEERMTSRSSSKLADELSSVWGNEASGSATRSPPTQSRGVEAPETVVEEASDSREEQHAEPSSSATPKTDSPKKPASIIQDTEPPPAETPQAADTPQSPAADETVIDAAQEDGLEGAQAATVEAIEPQPEEPQEPTAAQEEQMGAQEVDVTEQQTPVSPETEQPEVTTLSAEQEPENDEQPSQNATPTAETSENAPAPSPARSSHELAPDVQVEHSGMEKEPSRQPTPHGTPITDAFGATKLTPGLQHLALPEQIPLPLSTASSPKTPRAHGSPLSPFDNNLDWLSEGEHVFRTPSRVGSVAPSPLIKSSSFGFGGEDSRGAASPARSTKGRRSGGTPRRSRQPSATASPAAKVEEVQAED